jgi:hypothetical protein
LALLQFSFKCVWWRFFSKYTILYISLLFSPQPSYINLHGKNIYKPQKHPGFDKKPGCEKLVFTPSDLIIKNADLTYQTRSLGFILTGIDSLKDIKSEKEFSQINFNHIDQPIKLFCCCKKCIFSTILRGLSTTPISQVFIVLPRKEVLETLKNLRISLQAFLNQSQDCLKSSLVFHVNLIICKGNQKKKKKNLTIREHLIFLFAISYIALKENENLHPSFAGIQQSSLSSSLSKCNHIFI